jgi:hypothetical protein
MSWRQHQVRVLCLQATCVPKRGGSGAQSLTYWPFLERTESFKKRTQKRKRFLVEIDVPPCDQDAPAFSAETGQGVAVFGLVDKAIPVEVLGVLAVLAYSSRRVDAQSCFDELHGGRKEQRDGWLIFVGLRSLVRISSFTGKRARCRTQSSESEP